MFNELTESERNVIAYAIEEGFQNGVVGNIRWEINYEKHDWNKEDDNLAIIAEWIKDGKVMGYYPSWHLEAEEQ